MNKKNKKLDMEAKLFMFILDLKEEKNKKYSPEECATNIAYLFKDYSEFKNYFLQYGLVDMDDEFFNICRMKTTRKGTIIALKRLCDHAIRQYNIRKSNKPENSGKSTDNIEDDIQISLSGENGFYKLTISDYLPISSLKFDSVIASNKEFKAIYDELPASIFVDNNNLKINKGSYYFVILDGKNYIIFIDDNIIRINETISGKTDFECSKTNISVSRVFKYNKEFNQCDFTIYKHDEESKSCYWHMWYSNYCEVPIPEYELSKSDAFREINDLFANLENIDGINSIIDINFFREAFKNNNFTRSKNTNDK